MAPDLSEERINLGTYHALINNRGQGPAGTSVGTSIIGLLLERNIFVFLGRLIGKGKMKEKDKKESKRGVVFHAIKDGKQWFAILSCIMDEFVHRVWCNHLDGVAAGGKHTGASADSPLLASVTGC